jgi:hypothetical protein
MFLEKFPIWLFFTLITTISASVAASLQGQFELAVLFSFWASLSLSINGLINE